MKDEEDENMVVSLRGTAPGPAPVPRNRAFLERERPRRTLRGKRRRQIAMIAACCVVLAAIAIGWYAFSRHRGTASYNAAATSLASSTAESQQATAAETADVIAKVGALIDLPTGETPTVATVTDPGKLKDQPFFKNARSGDVVLLYTVAREAYLYDPVQNKLVEVAPITTSATQ